MPKILDACCGSRLFWFDKDCSFATYMDIREEEYEIHGKKINVKPDVVADFRDMPFENNVYDLVVFDPPHLKWAGQNSIMKGQYGQLDKENWPEDIKQGMSECMRVLKPSGTLIFKWNENQVKLKDVLKAVEPYSPLFGNKRSQTHWLVFMKEEQQKPVLPEFVAKWFEDAKDNLEIPIFYECVRAMEICKEYRNEFHQWFANSKKNTIETLIRMKDGYEVEKEPMYYVILSENKGGWKYTFLDEEGNADYTNNKAHIPTFTEKEIKGNDERFWPFAVPVKEVEG